jgi:hypothetical protein
MSLSEAYIILGTLFTYLTNHGYKEHQDFGTLEVKTRSQFPQLKIKAVDAL